MALFYRKMISKRIPLTLLGLSCLTLAQAADVSEKQAIEVAKEMVSGDVSSVKVFDYEGENAYYVVEFSKGGWVMVSADDMSRPVIGYSHSDRWPSETDMPDNFRGMMACYAHEVIENKHHLSERHAEWDPACRVAMARKQAASDDELKVPLIKVNWSQSGKFKKYCPKDSKGQALVGCVAVGMAQAMSVARWPERPVGSYAYTSSNYGSLYINYDNEPAYNWDDIVSGANDLDDVARLLWHCGVSINMNYGLDGSGTQTHYIVSAMQRNFNYPSSVRYYSRSSYDGDWTELIVNELREGRAVAYSGYDTKGNYGHCFNIDAYDGSFFHINWGWGASYNNDSWFSIDGLKDPNMKMNYDSSHGVVVGIRAPSPYPSNIMLSAKAVQAGQPAGTVVGDVIVESEASNPVYKYELKGKYSARQHKYLAAPFKVVNNQLVTTEVLEVGTQTVTITATNTENLHSIERTFNINVTEGPAGITEVGFTEVSRRYFSPSGAELQSPRSGLNIIRTSQADGSTKTVKVMK